MDSSTFPVTGAAGGTAGAASAGCCWAGADVLACSWGLSLLQAVKPMIRTKLQHIKTNLYIEFPPKVLCCFIKVL
jgi:hypothetical protein